MDNLFWDMRYALKDYVYGTQPNEFLKTYLLSQNTIGKSILLPADGEGRNAVFAAKRGMAVTAFDFSSSAIQKAKVLAEKNEVNVNFIQSSFQEFETGQRFDYIGLIFAHFSPKERAENHQKCANWLKPKGTLILEAFNEQQLNFHSGGPKNTAFLYSKKILEEDFSNLRIEYLKELEYTLNEGDFHQGKGSVIQLIGHKSK